ncbi:TPA: hypothetical protein HA241_07615 [Candidatus Woesearchaeota archaeon]|nr:hypothetical protein [Candidatus Woesearchaeota archaeon]
MDDLARIVLKPTNFYRTSRLEKMGYFPLFSPQSHVSRGVIGIVMSNGFAELTQPFYLDLTQMDRDHFPFTESDSQGLTQTWISRRSHLIVAYGVQPGQRPNGYGQHLPSQDSALLIEDSENIKGVLVNPGHQLDSTLVERVGVGGGTARFTRTGGRWHMQLSSSVEGPKARVTLIY